MIGISRLAKNEAAMKAVFDHLRNTAICGAMIGASIAATDLATGGYLKRLMLLMAAALLAFSGLWLLAVNIENALLKLKGTPFWQRLLFGVSYGLVLGILTVSILASRIRG